MSKISKNDDHKKIKVTYNPAGNFFVCNFYFPNGSVGTTSSLIGGCYICSRNWAAGGICYCIVKKTGFYICGHLSSCSHLVSRRIIYLCFLYSIQLRSALIDLHKSDEWPPCGGNLYMFLSCSESLMTRPKQASDFLFIYRRKNWVYVNEIRYQK